MKLLSSRLSGVRIFSSPAFADARGYFLETWNEQRYADSLGPVRFLQDNVSLSRRGVLRGLHFQNPNAQGKLITVLAGEVYDVIVDLRRPSPTFGQWEAFTISAENRLQLFLPAGFAHGFQVVSESALFHYKCTAFYSAADEHTLSWEDPDLGIPWPVPDPILSAKDRSGRRLRDLLPAQLFDQS
jgi:dTDP-4-dehydrorhamnose 3,5-epimerase